MACLTLTWEELRQRRGVFSVSRTLLEDNWRAVSKVLSRVIIIRCEFVFQENRFYYDAYSEQFAPRDDKDSPPVYVYDIDKEGVLTWHQDTP